MIRPFQSPSLYYPPRGTVRPQWPFGINRNSPQSEGLIAWWPFVLRLGTTVRDLVNWHELAFVNATHSNWTTDLITGDHLGVDLVQANSDYLTNNTAFTFTGFDPSNPWTMMGRVRIDAFNSAFGSALAIVDANGNEFASLGHDSASPGKLKIGSQGKTPGTGSTLATATEYDFGLVWNGTLLRGYLNGVEDYNVTPSSAITWASIDQVMLGASKDSGGTVTVFWDGVISDVRLHNIELTAEVHAQYHNQKTRWDLCQPILGAIPMVKAPAVGPTVPDQTLAPTSQMTNSGGMVGNIYMKRRDRIYMPVELQE